jgi:hypothetical protein
MGVIRERFIHVRTDPRNPDRIAFDMSLPCQKAREAEQVAMFMNLAASWPRPRKFIEVGRADSESDGPDYVIEDIETGRRFGLELTQVFLNDRSVPERHRTLHTYFNPPSREDGQADAYAGAVKTAILKKGEKAKRYDRSNPLWLFASLEEPEARFLGQTHVRELFALKELDAALENFSQIFLWPVAGDTYVADQEARDWIVCPYKY